MTTIQSTQAPSRHVRAKADHLRHPFDHSPEVLLALAAVLVVLAGPVVRAFAPGHALVSAASVALLTCGIVLAAGAAARLLRS